MKRIGLISDTHGFLDPLVFRYFDKCDEVWHAGDIGTMEVYDSLAAFRPVRAVYGNIDGGKLRQELPEELHFEVEGVRTWMIHIGALPPRYNKRIRESLGALPAKPNVLVCGHSHILRVLRDPGSGILYLNPGAAGHHGFHKVRTLLRFQLEDGRILGMEAIELGPRGRL